MRPARDLSWVRGLLSALRHQQYGQPNFQAVARNSGWMLLEKLVRMVLGLMVGAWVARYLGPTQYGELAYALAYIAFFQVIANMGLDGIVVRDLALHPKRAPIILGTAFVMRLSCGVGTWILAAVGMAVFNGWNDRSVLLVLLAGGSLVFQSGDTVDLWFQSQSQNRRAAAAKLIASLLSSGVKVVLIISEASPLGFAAVVSLDAMISVLGLTVAYRKLPCGRQWRCVWAQGAKFITESWPLILSGLSIMVYIRIDQLMIKEMLGERSLGIYAAILPLSVFWQVIPTTLSVSLAPFMAKQRLAGDAQYQNSVVLVFRIFFYLGVGVSLVTYALSGWLVPALYGPQYLDAVRVLDIHAMANIFCFMGIAHGLWLINERRFSVRLYGTMLAGASAVIVNYAMLSRVGLIGASYAAIVAQAIAAFLINGLLDRKSFWLQIEAITFRKR